MTTREPVPGRVSLSEAPGFIPPKTKETVRAERL
jgi:hypothetical protein